MSKRVSVAEMTILTELAMEWARKLEQLEKEMEGSTGETRGAYSLVYNDYLWKLQAKLGQLWYYVCGSDTMNPFTLDPPVPKSSDEATLEEQQTLADISAAQPPSGP